ncbi:MAG: LamG domain protein jellyroll fold domain protein [Pedosphaera sp.]|nr:LamG domain protein jellyroll fold domain protein [Pedosphaera sp.]
MAALALLFWLPVQAQTNGLSVITFPGSTLGTNGYLSGAVNGITTNTRAYFQYGADLNYGSFTSLEYFNPPGSQIVNATVKGLAPGTYHYRILAIDNTGAATGGDMTFTISGPSVTTLVVNVFSSDNVVLNGFVNPNGVATTAYFEYGTNTSYGNRTSVTNLAAGSMTSFVFNSINGLTTNPASHFRIVASNSVGVGIGADMTFSNQPQGLMSIPQAVFWNAGNSNPPVIQLQGSGAPPLTYSIVRTPRFGTIVTNVTGGFHTTNSGKCQYMPYAFNTFTGQDSFTFKVSNGTNSSAEATVSITVVPVNHAPHAEDQAVKVSVNTPCNGYLTGDDDADFFDPYSDLTNYSDPNRKGYHYSPGTPNLTYTILSSPIHGTLVTTNLPSFTYTPNTSYVGTDSFTFKVNDGALDSTNFGTVSIIVATNMGAIRPGFDRFSFGRADDQGFPVSLTGTNADWLGRDLLLQFSTNKFSSNYFTQFYANNNGNLTFASSNSNWNGQFFPVLPPIGPIIAPFWADVLTTDSRSGVMTYGMQYVGGRLAVGVTWTNVMTYQNTSNFNSFQVVLIDRSDVQVGDFDMEFNYDKIEWLKGAVSTGNPSVGFDLGNGSLYYNLPGAGTTTLVDTSTNGLIHNSNLIPPVPGRYAFRMYQPLALGQSIVALANMTNAVTLNPSPFVTLQGTFATNYAIVASPTNGTLSGSGPNRKCFSFGGPDSFTYTVSDGARYSTNTVTIFSIGLPVVFSPTASVGTNGSVTLSSGVYPFGDTTVYVRYGTTTNYGSLGVMGTIGFNTGQQLLTSSLETNQGAALTFNGVNQYVKVPGTISNDFTIEFWLLYPRLAGLVEGQWYQGLGLVDGYVPGKTNDFGVSIGNGKVLFGVGGPDTTIASGQLLDGNWHHVAATRVQTNGAMALYIDGVLAVSTNGSTATLNSATNLTIGCLQTLTNFFAGSLDEVRLWNVARSQSQIQLTMNQSLSGTNSGLVACYHMDDWPGTNAVDASGNGNTGSILNNPDWTSGNVPTGLLIPGATYYYQIVAVNAAGTNSTSQWIFTVAGTNAALSALTLSTGSFNPAFTPANLAYVSTVANSASNTDVTALSVDPHATIQIQTNGAAFSVAVSGGITNRVMLNYGTNVIRVKVTSQNVQNIQTYTLNITRLPGNDATLSSVTASGAVLALFGSTYYGTFPTTVSNTTITATANDPNATLKLDGISLSSGVPSGMIPLSFGNNTHLLTVTSQSGLFTTGYTLQLTRVLNNNADLASLTCSGGSLNPLFSSNVTSYVLTVSNNVSSITVTPTSVDSVYATIQAKANGGSYVPVSSGAASGALGLNIGTNMIFVAVTAQDGATVKIYTLTVTRQAGMAVATTQPAGSISATSAWLNANVNPNGAVTVFSFQYGPDTNYTKSTAATAIGSGTNTLSVSNLLGGLLPGTTNHFRVAASNSFGVVLGADMSFTNLADVPVVTNVTADGIAHSTVSLHGLVNPNGAVTVAYFQYGQSTNYGSSSSVTNLGGGIALVSFDAEVSNLLAGKTYHYQLVATNSAGTNSSGDMTFTLLSPPTTTSFSQQTGGSFQLQFSGGAGLSYTLQTSTDLTNWMNLTNLLAGTNGLFIFNDATATNSTIRFYRLSQP